MELDLRRPDGQLTIGDLRHAAERLEAMGRYESAHRMWTTMGRAAGDADDMALWNYADNRASDAIERAAESITERYRQSGVRSDYDAIARSRANGASIQSVAQQHGCSTSTVRRALQFVERRDELLAKHPDLRPALVEGADADRLSAFFDEDPKLMRWMLASAFDRRR
ncbi:MAG: hypothetical protein R2710_18380 [Acidimicrobiales bacterium]